MMNTKKDNQPNNPAEKKITRKQAIQKVGITALTAASVLFLSKPVMGAKKSKPAKPQRI